MSIGKTAGVLTAAAVLIGAFAVWLYADEKGGAEDPSGVDDEPPRSVRVGRVVALNSGPTVRLSAITKAVDHSRLSFAIGGRVVRRPVDVGDAVRRGEVVAKIELSPMKHAVSAGQAAVRELDARIDQAERNEARMSDLAEAGAVALTTHENAATSLNALQAARDAASARLSEAERQLRESVLRAPFSGTVSAVFVEPDEVVSPGQPVLQLDGAKQVEVELEVPEPLLSSVREGETVAVSFPLAGIEPVSGTISTVGQAAEGPGSLFPVVVTLPASEAIRPGLTASVALSSGRLSGLAVDVGAVINPTGQKAWVLRVIDGVARRVPVTTGALVDGRVQVSGDFHEGDWVVTAGHQQLMDGDRVEIR
jgi:RND family efflux transporter MFP subunit